jgi:Fe2+ or Zn2+ uptake regulation protein
MNRRKHKTFKRLYSKSQYLSVDEVIAILRSKKYMRTKVLRNLLMQIKDARLVHSTEYEGNIRTFSFGTTENPRQVVMITEDSRLSIEVVK